LEHGLLCNSSHLGKPCEIAWARRSIIHRFDLLTSAKSPLRNRLAHHAFRFGIVAASPDKPGSSLLLTG
jgi:hypothetical protein